MRPRTAPIAVMTVMLTATALVEPTFFGHPDEALIVTGHIVSEQAG